MVPRSGLLHLHHLVFRYHVSIAYPIGSRVGMPDFALTIAIDTTDGALALYTAVEIASSTNDAACA